MIPIGHLRPYRRWNDRQIAKDLNDYVYLQGRDIEPGSQPIFYSYSYLENVVNDIKNRIFRHHHNLSTYFFKPVINDKTEIEELDIKDNYLLKTNLPTLGVSHYKFQEIVPIPLRFNYEFKERDTVGFNYFKRDFVKEAYNPINYILSKERFGKVSKRLDSYSVVDDTFKDKYRPMAQIMSKIFSVKIKTEIEKI